MGNWFTDTLNTISNARNEFDRWVNPFHYDVSYNEEGERVVNEERHGLLEPVTKPAADYTKRSMEEFFRAYNWLYSNGFSQPMATARLQAQRSPDNWFSASEWSRTWRAAEHISFAQAGPATPGFGGLRDRGGEELVERVIDADPARYTPPKAYLPEDWDELPYEDQQRLLADADMPIIGNQEIERIRNEDAFYRNYTGFEDALGRIFADPFILAGKGIGAARRATMVKRRPKGGWTTEKIDKLVSSSNMSKMHDFLWANKDNPALINNTDLARHSAMGPRFGAIVSTLESERELSLFLRAGMGDIRATRRLGELNALAAARIESDTSRLAAIDIMHARYAGGRDPRMAALAQAEMDRLNGAIQADSAMVGRYDEILEHADLLDEIRVSRWSTARAEARTKAQRQYLTGPAKGSKARRQGAFTTSPIVGKLDPKTGAPIGREVETGFVNSRLWGVGDFFSTPVTLVRSIKNASPRGYMALDQGAYAEGATVAELRAHVARIPGIREEHRQNIMNEWLKTASEGERKRLLDDVSRLATGKIAKKHGLSPAAGQEIFEAQRQKIMGELDTMKQYSAAQTDNGLRVDAFEVEGGIKIAPHTVTRIMNSHVLPDLKQFDKVLARHGSALRALRESHAGNPDWIVSAGDMLNQLWKFGTLFRLGYIPRTIGDDIASQWARLGSAAMMMRVGYGVKNAATNLAHREERTFAQLQEQTHLARMNYVDDELKVLKPEMKRVSGRLAAERASRERELVMAENRLGKAEARLSALPSTATPVAHRAHQTLVDRRLQQLNQARARTKASVPPGKLARARDLELQVGNLERFRELAARGADDAKAKQQKQMQGADPIEIDGVVYPSAFGGQRGDYTLKRISADRAMEQLFKEGKSLVHANLMRSFDHGARPISTVDDATKHGTAWAHAINAQIAQDKMQRMLVAGHSEAEVAHWLKNNPQGKAYMKRLGLKFADPEDIAARARHEVDEYLPLPEIRAQALTPEGVTPDFLAKALPNVAHRPTVHMANVGVANLHGLRAMDRVMDWWYNMAASMPANRLSRHPLFNQLYEGHLKTISAQRTLQGAKPTVDDAERLAESARRLAERDMKKLVFDIAHRSDAAAALRWVSPFFSATAESFQRWGRVIADRPEVTGYAGRFYNAPAYSGAMQDQDGNTIQADGTAMVLNPETGKMERRLVPKAERFIVGRVPKGIAESPLGLAFGMEPASGNFVLSQNSMNIVTQGDPWFSPGVGPVVQIPVGEFVKDKPDQAELARHLGILPYGPATGGTPLERGLRQSAPGALRHFLTAWDTSDHRYQQVKMQILQRAIYDHQENGKPMPSAQEIADRTRNYWFLSAGSAFLQPMATRRKDAFQFYRDQYNNLRRANPETADMEFIDKFGEEFFIFAQSMSKNQAGVPATRRAVELSKQYADVLQEHPDLGALIIGPEGNGPFSPEAYAYQLNTPLTPGDPESQRRRMTAEEAVQENQKRLGWTQFTKVMNWVNSQLLQRGLSNLEDEGAEDLAAMKQAIVALLGEPTLPDGEENPHYNEAWSKDWFSFDTKKYERLIPALSSVAKTVLKKDPERGDLRTLLIYLEGRKAVEKALEQRDFSSLGAQANADLRAGWLGFVGTLTEQNTDFGDLHSRYLSRDLGVDTDEEAEVLAALEEEGVGV